jgi:hypothetical protein
VVVHDERMGRRLTWEQLPGQVRNRVETLSGGRVVAAYSQEGGFSRAFASRCEIDGAGPVFVKAVSAAQNERNPGILRAEIAAWDGLPAEVPGARLRASADDGEWVLGIFDWVDGSTPPPWRTGDLDAVRTGVQQISSFTRTPRSSLAEAVDRYADTFGGWRALAGDAGADLTPWEHNHLDDLVAIEDRWPDAIAGDALIHGDIRSDNTVLTSAGDAVFVDWTEACWGSPLFDYLAMIPSLTLEGQGQPWELVTDPWAAPGNSDAALTIVVACAGYFAHRRRQPTPRGLPTVRQFQAAQGDVCNAWIDHLLAIDPGS